jgi:NAD(P)-dependent dehydrogenase (short-subunit alcohol dehydrogenase family)
MERHQERRAVVTGAGQGIGRAIVTRLVAEGARVVAFDKNAESVQGLAGELGDRCVPFVGDVAVEADCESAVSTCVTEFGGLDIMAAHAGIAEPRPFLDVDAEHWRRHMSVNLDGAFYCGLYAARHMVSAGQPGSIVYTASINGFHVEETMASYNVTKGALITLARSTAIDLGRHGIRANAVAPGVVDTPISELVVHNPDLAPAYLRTIPLGRFGQPDDIAAAVSWLSSDEASYVTGQTLVVDGGQTLGIAGDLTGGSEGGAS